jgi:endonuclease/exonuclease/phosphatase family metal-dependent hydrolase
MELLKEKKNLEKKYSVLLGDFNKFADKTEKRVVHKNYHKIIAKGRRENEMEAVKQELSKLKEKEKNWEAKKETLKKDKKKLLYMIFDLFKDGSTNKEKFKKIKIISEK